MTLISKIFIGLFAVSCAVLSYFSMVQAATNILDTSMERTTRRWMCGREAVDPKEIEHMLRQIQTGIRFNPYYSELYYRKAQLNTAYAAILPVWNQRNKEIREYAQKGYLDALKVRPAWPMALINLLQNKILSGEVTEAELTLIDDILKTGKWQAEVQSKLVWLTLGIWESIPNTRRAMLQHHFGQVMSSEKIFYTAIAAGAHYGLLEEVAKFDMSEQTRNRFELIMTDKEKLKNILDDGSSINSFC